MLKPTYFYLIAIATAIVWEPVSGLILAVPIGMGMGLEWWGKRNVKSKDSKDLIKEKEKEIASLEKTIEALKYEIQSSFDKILFEIKSGSTVGNERALSELRSLMNHACIPLPDMNSVYFTSRPKGSKGGDKGN